MVSTVLIDGEVGLAQFAPERIAPDDVQALLRKVVTGPGALLTRRITQDMPVAMTVRTADRCGFDGHKSDYDGFHTRPISCDLVEPKFDRITAKVLAPPRARDRRGRSRP